MKQDKLRLTKMSNKMTIVIKMLSEMADKNYIFLI